MDDQDDMIPQVESPFDGLEDDEEEVLLAPPKEEPEKEPKKRKRRQLWYNGPTGWQSIGEVMSEFPLASRAGVTKKAIKKATSNGVDEKALMKFIHGDINVIHNSLPKPSGLQEWETTGKRFVQLEEARFVAKHFLRNAVRPSSSRALVLSGTDPALACLPWAMSGIATRFVAYERDLVIWRRAMDRQGHELRKITTREITGRECELHIVYGDILHSRDGIFGVIDLDFCSNQLRIEKSRAAILNLVDRTAPATGPFVFRTTIHLGRVGNSLEDVEHHIEDFERELKEPDEEYQAYKVRAFDRSPYQSSLPMVSLLWILERQHSHV